MKNGVVACISDSVLSGFIVFLAGNIFLRTLISSPVAVNIISIVLGMVICAFLFLILWKKNKLKLAKAESAKKWQNILSELEIMPDNRLIGLFLPIFKDVKIIKTEDNFIQTENSVYMFDYYEKSDREKAVKLLRQSNGKTAILFCNTPSDDCADFCKKHDISVYDKTTLPGLQEKYSLLLPEPVKNNNENGIFEKIKKTLVKLATFKRSASFAFSAAALFLFAKISFFPKWYTVCGIILLAFATLLLVIKIATKKQPSSIEKNELFN